MTSSIALRNVVIMSFEVTAFCVQLERQKQSPLLVAGRKESISFMKYANHDRIVAQLRKFFGDVGVLDGGVDEYTNPAVTGDQTGTVWSLPDCPPLKSLEDIADSILACHAAMVRAFRTVEVLAVVSSLVATRKHIYVVSRQFSVHH
jgi:hypothetical protein